MEQGIEMTQPRVRKVRRPEGRKIISGLRIQKVDETQAEMNKHRAAFVTKIAELETALQQPRIDTIYWKKVSQLIDELEPMNAAVRKYAVAAFKALRSTERIAGNTQVKPEDLALARKLEQRYQLVQGLIEKAKKWRRQRNQ